MEKLPPRERRSKQESKFLSRTTKTTPPSKGFYSFTFGIPHFWLTALRNHVGLNDLISDRDAEALKHLLDVRLEYLKEGEGQEAETKGQPGYKILFYFGPNEYFENDVLVKTYVYQEEVGYWGDFVYDRAFGTTIKWKEDKDLTKEFEIKKQRNKSTPFFNIVMNRRINFL
jgi:nucleosome assembly protein 1-like 1